MRLKLLVVVAAVFAAVSCWYWLESHRPAPSPAATGVRNKNATRLGTTGSLQRGSRTPAVSVDKTSTERQSLAPPASLVWERAADRPEFSRFVEWTQRYRSASTPAEKSALEVEGVALAQARRDVLAQLIRDDPKRSEEHT